MEILVRIGGQKAGRATLFEQPQKRRRGQRSASVSRWLLGGLGCFCVLLASCEGGGQRRPSADFSLAITPASLSIGPGNPGTASLTASGSNGFASQISVQVSELVAGVTVSPSVITVTPGTPQTLTFSADASAASGNATATFTGTSGALSHTATLALTIRNASAVRFGIRYVRTDATTAYRGWLNSHWIVYHPPTSRFFVTDPGSNRVFALDAHTQAIVGTSIVPGAFSIDDTPDHNTLYVGTQIGDVYTLDPLAMAVTRRFRSSEIGPDGFSANLALVLADGRLGLLGGQGGIPSVDGYSEIAIWNPVDNSLSRYGPEACGSTMGNIGVFTRTQDRTSLVMAGIANVLCKMNASTGAATYVGTQSGFIWRIAISPDGNWIAIPSSGQALVYDGHTLARVRQFNVAGDTSAAAGFFIGPDSNTLFAPSSTTVYAYDLGTGTRSVGCRTSTWNPVLKAAQ